MNKKELNELQKKILGILTKEGMAIRDISTKIKESYYLVNLEISKLEGMGILEVNKIGGTKVVRRI